MLVLKFKRTSEPNFPSLWKINKLDLKLIIINIIELNIFAQIIQPTIFQ